jgi:hypothetical protein
MNWTSCASAGNPAGECRRGRNPRRAVRRGPGNRSRRGVLGTRDSRDESSAGPLPVRALAWAEPAAGKTPGREQPRRGSTEPNRCYRPAGAMERRPTSKEDGHFAATRGRQCRRTRKALEGTRETPALSPISVSGVGCCHAPRREEYRTPVGPTAVRRRGRACSAAEVKP